VRAAVVWRLEDLLALSAEPYEARYPLGCVADRPYPLVSDVRHPLPVAPGPPRRYDDAYRRQGTCPLVLGFEPRQGWRHVKGTDRRTTQDVAHWMRDLVDIHGPKAAVIRVGLDNLNTHTPAALYATFPPADAWRSVRPLAVHDPPTPGRWLNRAAIEGAVVATQGLDRRLGHQETVRRAIRAWETRRHAAKATGDWRLTTTKARRKLNPIYPL
jgi:hypothetical protein